MPEKARLYLKLISFYAFLMNLVIASIVYYGSYHIAIFFTDQKDLIKLIDESIGIMGLVIIIHGASMVLGGAMRGIGMQSIATWVVLIGFYLIAMPASYMFTFYWDFGLTGLWMGSVAGSIVEFLIYTAVLMFFINWETASRTILERLRNNNGRSPSSHKNNTLDDPLLFDTYDHSIGNMERKQISFSP